ncbi:ubinuclein-1-like isoform X2 [Ptychodera flava]|uniref:ubinuclein-1-like isoform X2 n=1 Tax=Ptychodera flava TaxID=63121 RepID=UPI00396A3810
MAEPRRIIPVSAEPTDNKEKTKKVDPTLRFSLTLTDSTEKTCPEFSYGELVKNALGERKKSKGDKSGAPNSANPFNDLDENDMNGIQELAKRFEAKYGPKPGKKRKRDRIEDLIDASWGYDETDPFVDNSQAYDELVPAELTTQLGGFYINSGDLEFRPISSSDDSDADFQDPNKKKKSLKKKRKSLDGIEKEKKRKLKDSSSPFKKPRKQLQRNGAKVKKSTPTVAELLQRQKPTAVKTSVSDGEQESSDNMSKNILDSINAVVHEAFAVANTSEPNTTGGSDSEGNTNSEVSDAVPKLPTNLSADLERNIDKMKSAAMSADGKCKFFTADINKTLLHIERQSRELSCGVRSSIYGHLASHLPCSKETLLKRAKKLRLNEQDSRLKEPLQKLKEAVGRIMPEQLDRYQEECQQAAQNKMMEDRMKDGDSMKTGSDEEEDEKTKRNMAPRKKFRWTDEIRKLLCDVVAIKVKTYEMSKTRSQSAEDYLKQFLDAEIKPLWPQGWMQTRMLFKECRSVHGHMTLAPNKQKKFFTTAMPSSTPISTAAATITSTTTAKKQIAGKKQTGDSTADSSNATPVENNVSVPTLLDYAEKTPSTCTTEESQESDELFQIKREKEKQLPVMTATSPSSISAILKSELLKKEKPTPAPTTGQNPMSSVTAMLKKELLKREKSIAASAKSPTVDLSTSSPLFTTSSTSTTAVPSMPNTTTAVKKEPNLNAWKGLGNITRLDDSPLPLNLHKAIMSPQVRVSPIPLSTLQNTSKASSSQSKNPVSNYDSKALTKPVQGKLSIMEPNIKKAKTLIASPVDLQVSSSLMMTPNLEPASLKPAADVQRTVTSKSNVPIHVPAKLTIPSTQVNRTIFTTTSTRLVSSSSTTLAASKQANELTLSHSHNLMRPSIVTQDDLHSNSATAILASFSQNVSRSSPIKSKEQKTSPVVSKAAIHRTSPSSSQEIRNMYNTMIEKSNSSSSSKSHVYPGYSVSKSPIATTALYSSNVMNTTTTTYASKPVKSTKTSSMPPMTKILSPQLSPQLPTSASGYGESMLARNVSPRLLQTSSVVTQVPVVATTTSAQGMRTVSSNSGLLGGASNVTNPNMAGYQSITLVDMTRDSPLPKHHPLSRDAIITGPAPGTFSHGHGQGAMFTSMHSSPPHHQLPPVQSFQHQSYTETPYNREGTPKMPRKYP